MQHFPILRAGSAYRSLNTLTVKDFRTGEAIAQLSLANTGLIRNDFSEAANNKLALEALPIAELLKMCKNAAHLFLHEELPVDEASQSPDEYVRLLSLSTGMPEGLCRLNMAKIYAVLNEMEAVLGGLTRGLDLSILDTGWGEQNTRTLSYLCQTRALGAILPNNSPGVHSLWLPSIPLKVPLMIKPGSQEPWTPFRIIQAFLAAGCPPQAFGYYPTDYAGANEILLRSERSMLFGGVAMVKAWENDPRVQIHGPGWSKIIVGTDKIDRWQQYEDTIVDSILINSGRSCLNASSVWTPENGYQIAESLAQRLSQVPARALDDPQAQLAAFANPLAARRISEMIDRGLAQGGAEDLTARYRDHGRLIEKDGCTFLLPTLVWCESAEHPLANTELLFPFASVVEYSEDTLFEQIGQTLVATALTADRKFIQKLLNSRNIDRLNIGAIPTCTISWDQPHEGNLFEHLYKQRALQMATG
ncbi:MAG: aldehyde dehydrogenase family protein [bacterium]